VGQQPNISQNIIKNLVIPMPDIETQEKKVMDVLNEEKMIESNNTLVKTFQEKIKNRIAKVWGEG